MLRNSILWFILFLAACQKQDNTIPEIWVDIDHPEYCQMDRFFYEPEVVFLQHDTLGFLGSVSKVFIGEHKIYVLDKQLNSVGIFERNGKYLTVIRPAGRGPGEFDHLTDFFVDENKGEFVIYADRPYKFLYYDLEGHFKKEVLCRVLYKEIALGEDGMIVALNTSEKAVGYLSFICYDRENTAKEIFSNLPYKGTGDLYTEGMEMNRSEKLNFTRRGDNIIYSLKGTEIIPRYRVDFGSYALPEHLNGLKRYDEKMIDEIVTKRYVFSMVNIKETPEYLFFNTVYPSTFVLKKKEADLRYYRMMDWMYNVYHNQMVPSGDGDNRLIVYSKWSSKLKTELPKDKLEELPIAYREQLQQSTDETDNPVLFIYRTREE